MKNLIVQFWWEGVKAVVLIAMIWYYGYSAGEREGMRHPLVTTHYNIDSTVNSPCEVDSIDTK